MNLSKFYEEWRQWFNQPYEVKAERLRKRDPVTLKGRGNWAPPGSESPGYDFADTHKEYVHLKWDDVAWENSWAKTSRHLFLECWASAQSWLKARDLDEIAATLQLEDQVLRVLRYLPHPTGEVGAAHVDFDLFTINLPGTAPGLERLVAQSGPNQVWKLEEEGVHVGRQLEICTSADGSVPHDNLDDDDAFATVHRVRTLPNIERMKAVFFVLPPTSWVLRPGRDGNPDYTSGQYLKGVLNKASPVLTTK